LYQAVTFQYGTNIELILKNVHRIFEITVSMNLEVIVLLFENPVLSQFCEIQNFLKYQFFVNV